MADEGNEDSWLYGNTKEDGTEEDANLDGEEPPGGDGKNGSPSAAEESQPQWEAPSSKEDQGGAGGSRAKRPRSSYSDDEDEEDETAGRDQHEDDDDNAMDSSDLPPIKGGPARRGSDLTGEEDSHMQEDESREREEGTNRSDGEMDESDDSDDEDDINVIIKSTGPSYSILKPRGPIIPPQAAPAAPGQDKAKQPAGKFSIDEFESVGTINGVPAHEFSIDSLDEKPWRKPGADITDYFNYGFNEETWRAYCERQKRMRLHESGVGLQGLTINNPQAAQPQNNWRPPPPRKMNNGIDVIGGMNPYQRPEGDMMPRHPKENVIQVMTADRREYSRSAAKFDAPMPPFGAPPEFYHNEPDYGDYGYEPTQESQWNQESAWQPHGIKTLTPGPMMPPGMGMPPHMMPPPMQPGMPMGPPGMGPPGMRSHDRGDRGDHRGDRRDRARDMEREHRRDSSRPSRREPSIKESSEPDRSQRSEKSESRSRDFEREKRSVSKSDRHKESSSSSSSKHRERSREKSKSRRRSSSRDRERHSSSSRTEKSKKSHRKDKDESD